MGVDLFPVNILKPFTMKKTILSILGLGLCLSFCVIPMKAQDEKPTKVTITITENDVVTTDTTFTLAEGQDPEIIKEIVTKLSGDHPDHKHEKMMVISSLDSTDHHIIKSSDHHTMVITGKEIDEDRIKVIVDSFEKRDEEGEVKVIVGSSEKGSGESDEKTVNVFVYSDNDESPDEEEKEVKVIVIGEGDEDIKIEKKIKVEVRKEDDKESTEDPEKN
jgi:hypothetical protein